MMSPAKPALGKTISIANAKGGVGKSTCTLFTAGALAAAGHKVQVVDLDGQGSSLIWAANRAQMGRAPAFDVTRAPAPGYDWTVYDHPPGLPQKVNTRAHVVLVPTFLALFDLAATGSFVKDLHQAGQRFLVVPNRYEKVSGHISALAELFPEGHPYLKKHSSIQTGIFNGVTPYDEKSGIRDALVIRQHFDEVMDHLVALLTDPSRQLPYTELVKLAEQEKAKLTTAQSPNAPLF